jgi:hypothetical protein
VATFLAARLAARSSAACRQEASVTTGKVESLIGGWR